MVLTTDGGIDRRAPELEWPAGFDRTPADEREPYPGDLSPTRKESFQSVVGELERWGATEVEISTASTHYADRPNIPHQHDRPDDVGVAAYYRREGEPADQRYALACDRWESQRENARAVALYARRMRLAEKCGVATAQSTHATARLPPGDDQAATAAGDVIAAEPAEPELSDQEAADALGITPDVPNRVVRTAFEEAIKNEHPDRGGNGDVDRLQRARDQLLDEA